MGVGFAITLILLRSFLSSRATSAEAGGALLTVSILMMCVAAAAIRTVFSMPITLKANWLFRLAAFHPVATYSKAIRRCFLLLAVAPVWVVFAALFFSIWPWRIAGAHLMALGLLGSILGDLCAHGFHKIPFTCSYQPGKANIQFGFWGFIVLLPLTWMAGNREWNVLQHASGRAILAIVLGIIAIAARWRTTKTAKSADTMLFEEMDEAEILSLELPNDAVLLRNNP